MNATSQSGLTINDIYKLIYEPTQFELNSDNMTQTYTLFHNLYDLFVSNLK